MGSASSAGWEERVDAEARAERDAGTLDGIVLVLFWSFWLFIRWRRGYCGCGRKGRAVLKVVYAVWATLKLDAASSLRA